MRGVWGVLALVLLGGSSAPELSGWECTTETLASGDRCVFQGMAPEKASADAEGNVKAMSALAESLCSLHLKPSERTASSDAVMATCKTEVAQTAKQACSTRGALMDDQGRFLPSAKGCYRALTEVRQHAEWQALTLAPCCSCLAEQHCVAAANQCVASAQSTAAVEAANPKCALSSCESACVGLLPESHAEADAPTKSRVSRR